MKPNLTHKIVFRLMWTQTRVVSASMKTFMWTSEPSLMVQPWLMKSGKAPDLRLDVNQKHPLEGKTYSLGTPETSHLELYTSWMAF